MIFYYSHIVSDLRIHNQNSKIARKISAQQFFQTTTAHPHRSAAPCETIYGYPIYETESGVIFSYVSSMKTLKTSGGDCWLNSVSLLNIACIYMYIYERCRGRQ